MPMYKAQEVLYQLEDVYHEVGRQESLWGVQKHPDGTGGPEWAELAELAKKETDEAEENGTQTWANILKEEFTEVMAADNVRDLLPELTQLAAVCMSWVRDINDR